MNNNDDKLKNFNFFSMIVNNPFIFLFIFIFILSTVFFVFTSSDKEKYYNQNLDLEKDEKTTLILQEESYNKTLEYIDIDSILIHFIPSINHTLDCYYNFFEENIDFHFDTYCTIGSNFLDSGYIKLLKDNGKWTAYMPKNRFEQKHEHYQSVIDDALLMIKYKKQEIEINKKTWEY